MVTYELIAFTSPRAQSGVVIAHPPPDCAPKVRPMLVAYVDELNNPNPLIVLSGGLYTKGMLEGITRSISSRWYTGTRMMDRYKSFRDIAYEIGLDPFLWYDAPEKQIARLGEDKKVFSKYIKSELESYT